MSCNVCIEPFNRSNRVMLACTHCGFESCKECNETYLMSSKELSHCMNCKSDWDYRTLYSLFTHSFQKKYKKHIENILFDRERAMLPATQPFVEEKKMKKLINNEIKKISEEIDNLIDNPEYNVNSVNYNVNYNENEDETAYNNWKFNNENDYDNWKFNNEKQDDKTIEIVNLTIRKWELEQKLKSLNIETQNFIKKCTVQNCPGFLNYEWKCGMCNNETCKDCHDVLQTNTTHKCNPENVETVKLLSKDSKGCPKCATPIFKIDGCDQIFCTLCHTAFSWNTGKIESGVIHNPHFMELQENQERNLLEIRCGREIDRNIIIYLYNLRLNPQNNPIYLIAAATSNIRRIELPKYANGTINDNFDLRFKFLESTITEESFKLTLHKRHKENSKKQEIAHVLNMYTNCVTEIIYRYIVELQQNNNNVNYRENFKSIEKKHLYEIYSLMDYTNLNLIDLSKIYKTRLLKIDEFGNFY